MIECPAEVCDFKGPRDSVAGHYHGSHDDAHSGHDVDFYSDSGDGDGDDSGSGDGGDTPPARGGGGDGVDTAPARGGEGDTGDSGRARAETLRDSNPLLQAPNSAPVKDTSTTDAVDEPPGAGGAMTDGTDSERGDGDTTDTPAGSDRPSTAGETMLPCGHERFAPSDVPDTAIRVVDGRRGTHVTCSTCGSTWWCSL